MLRPILIVLMFSTSALSEESNPRPSEHKTEVTQTNEQNGAGSQQIRPPAAPIPAPVVNARTAKHAGEESHCAQPKDWKEWGAFAWCKADAWIDAERIIAVFTVILGIATWLLWRATERLVKGAEHTAQRQLRAYLSVTPHKVLNWTNDIDAIGATFSWKNHGQTPALEVVSEFTIEVRDTAPDLDAFQEQANFGIAIFPGEETPSQLIKTPRFSHEEIKDVEAGTRRAHIWGRLHYRDAFGVQHSTIINVSFGGPDFAKNIRKNDGSGWNWIYGDRHNEPT
jgi:hypothetical protein